MTIQAHSSSCETTCEANEKEDGLLLLAYTQSISIWHTYGYITGCSIWLFFFSVVVFFFLLFILIDLPNGKLKCEQKIFYTTDV